MTIRISGVKQAPLWVTTQRVIRETLNTEGQLTRITRPDGQCNYREIGEYHLTFTPDNGDNVTIKLQVEN
jgi:hypothetical protein